MSKRPAWPLSSTLDRLLMDNPRKRRVSFVLGQNIFTPEDIRATKLISDDRPYAGWLYLGLGLVTERKTKKNVEAVDNFEIDIGMVGPAAFGIFGIAK